MERISLFSKPVRHEQSTASTAILFTGHSSVTRFRPLSQNGVKILLHSSERLQIGIYSRANSLLLLSE